MEWKYVSAELPITYLKGDWDGKKSDEVLVEDVDGQRHLAVLYSGKIDGAFFNDWYNTKDYEIHEIIRWCKIPD